MTHSPRPRRLVTQTQTRARRTGNKSSGNTGPAEPTPEASQLPRKLYEMAARLRQVRAHTRLREQSVRKRRLLQDRGLLLPVLLRREAVALTKTRSTRRSPLPLLPALPCKWGFADLAKARVLGFRVPRANSCHLWPICLCLGQYKAFGCVSRNGTDFVPLCSLTQTPSLTD